MSNPIEISVFEFLETAIAAAADTSALCDIELHDTVYQKIQSAAGVRISECVSMPSPGVGGEIKEIDAVLTLVVFAKVEGKDKSARAEALTRCWAIESALVSLLNENASLGDRVCDLLIGRSVRGYDVFDGEPFAVANIPLTVNPMGDTYKNY